VILDLRNVCPLLLHFHCDNRFWCSKSINWVVCHLPRKLGRTRGSKVGAIPLAPSHYGGAKLLRGAPKSPNDVTNTSFNTVHFLPKELRFEHWGARLASCPGRHLTSLRPCWKSHPRWRVSWVAFALCVNLRHFIRHPFI